MELIQLLQFFDFWEIPLEWSLREKCPNAGKYGPEITPYLGVLNNDRLDFESLCSVDNECNCDSTGIGIFTTFFFL